MSMSYPYKPVLILSVLSNDGTESLDEAANFFLSFYGRRLELGLVAEKSKSIYSDIGWIIKDMGLCCSSLLAFLRISSQPAFSLPC